MSDTEKYQKLLDQLETIDDGKWGPVARQLRLFWGTPTGHKHLFNYLFDTEVSTRMNFPEDVLQLMFQISSEHSRYYDPLV